MHAADVVTALLTSTVRPPSQAHPPSAAGFYAWWCREERLADADPVIPLESRPPVARPWSLLYVGISPSSAASSRDIASRFRKDHVSGNIGGSTFRQSLAALLLDTLKLQVRPGSDRSRLVTEAPLSRWMETSCGVTFARSDRPWELERAVIQQLNPPLNLDSGTHPFRTQVSAQRTALRRACGVGS